MPPPPPRGKGPWPKSRIDVFGKWIAYDDLWSARGAKFITEPKVHATEIRCYMRDPDGYLIEVGQTTMTAGPLDLYK